MAMEAILGKLLKFDRRRRPANAGTAISGDAQILLFTGVRYERDAPPPTTELDNKRRRRKRG